jgi:hypothetical protein
MKEGMMANYKRMQVNMFMSKVWGEDVLWHQGVMEV